MMEVSLANLKVTNKRSVLAFLIYEKRENTPLLPSLVGERRKKAIP